MIRDPCKTPLFEGLDPREIIDIMPIRCFHDNKTSGVKDFS